MSVPMRIVAVELETGSGWVRHAFTGPLTVLSGPVGVGKSSLFESIKYAVGGSARIAPVIRDHVTRVRLTMQIEDQLIQLTRRIGVGGNFVEVLDLQLGAELGRFPIQAGKGASDGSTISEFLMGAMGLPTAVYSTSKTRSRRITFSSIWSFVYVEQREIDRSVARNNDSYAEPTRKATFELLFGLTDSDVLTLKKAELDAENELALAVSDERVVLDFLAESRTSTRDQVQSAVRDQYELKASALAQLAKLHDEAESVRGEVGVVRDLVLNGRTELGRLQSARTQTVLAHEEQTRLLGRLKTRAAETVRADEASRILAPIDFVICPRCAQSITNRQHDSGACSLCLQPEPVADQSLTRRSQYEADRLAAQISEVETLIESAKSALQSIDASVETAQQNLAGLEALLDERTRFFVSPRLEQYADASAAVASADAVVGSMEAVLRQWDRAADLANARIHAERQLAETRNQRTAAESSLREVRERLLDALSGDYRDMVTRIGVPSVTDAYVDSNSYLPYVNGDKFDKLSTGGITTALVTAYWVTVLATALRERETNYPTLLILDSPRKSIGQQNASMVNELYKQLDVLAETYGDRMQVILADNDIPSDISRRWQDLRFDYDKPTVATIEHPGPAGVQTLEDLE